MWRRPLEWNLNRTTDPRDGSVDHLSLNSLKDRHGPIRAPKSLDAAVVDRLAAIRHETVRFWWNRFGPMFAAEIRKKRVAHMRGYPQWRWHLDEAFVKVKARRSDPRARRTGRGSRTVKQDGVTVEVSIVRLEHETKWSLEVVNSASMSIVWDDLFASEPPACGTLGSPLAKWMTKISYAGYWFPPEVIHQAIWLYLRFTLSLRDVEDLLAERGVAVSYETVRRWVCVKKTRQESDRRTPPRGAHDGRPIHISA